MTTEQALIEIRKIRYSFSHKLLSVDITLKKVSDILDLIEKNDLGSVIAFRMTRDDFYIHRTHYQKAATLISKEALILSNIEFVIRDLETELLNTDFTKDILAGKSFTSAEIIDGLEEFKQTATIDSVSISKWLGLISEVAKKIFGNTSNEYTKSTGLVVEHDEKCAEADTDKDIQVIDSGYRLKGILLLDYLVKATRAKAKQNNSVPSNKLEKNDLDKELIKEQKIETKIKKDTVNYFYFNKTLFITAVLGICTILFFIVDKWNSNTKENAISKYDIEKNNLYLANVALRSDSLKNAVLIDSLSTENKELNITIKRLTKK